MTVLCDIFGVQLYRGARTGDSSEANNPWLKISYLF